MNSSTLTDTTVEQFSAPNPYTLEVVLRTFIVRKNRQADSFVSPPPARNSEDETLDADKEHFVLLAFNQKHRLISYKHISTGSLTASLVHPREVFTAGLELRATALIFIDNHPSDPMPSQEDVEIARRLKERGEILGFRILDHIILGRDRIYSFSDRLLYDASTFANKKSKFIHQEEAMKTTLTTIEPDVCISDEGTLFLFRLLTRNAERWVEENVEPGYQTFGNAVAIEHRYAMALANVMMSDGLRVRIR